ncbi:MAG: hypothetical protein EXQ71_03030 [Acidimicrobiia bacterium]|nr:hypothetical protein [Acidimicrobiia bacterium]
MRDQHEVPESVSASGPNPGASRRIGKRWWSAAAVGVLVAGVLAFVLVDHDSEPPRLPIAFGVGGTPLSVSLAPQGEMAHLGTYVAGPDLPRMGGEAPAYRVRTAAVDQAQVRAVAAALGLSGEPVEQGDRSTVTGEQGVLSVFTLGHWSFSAAGSVPGTMTVDSPSPQSLGGEVLEGMAVYEPVPMPAEVCRPDATCDGGATVSITPSATPVDLPSTAQARSIALEVLASAGMETTDAIVSVGSDGGPDRNVTVESLLNGVPSGLMASVSVGSGGTIVAAFGWFGAVEVLGKYPTISTGAAIDRLNESGDGAIGRLDGLAETGVVTPETAIDPGEAGGDPTFPQDKCVIEPDGSGVCASPAQGVPCAPEGANLCPSTETPPEVLPPLEIVLTGATEQMIVLPANDGSRDSYLVPGYRLTGEAGVQIDVPAIAEGALAIATRPSQIPMSSPVPVDPPVTIGCVSPVAPPDNSPDSDLPVGSCVAIVPGAVGGGDNSDPAGTTGAVRDQ